MQRWHRRSSGRYFRVAPSTWPWPSTRREIARCWRGSRPRTWAHCGFATASRRRCGSASRPRRIGNWCGAARRFSHCRSMPAMARAVWNTCDRIWTALGDRSDDVNWYTQRATLAGVYSSTVLYWLGDERDGAAATWEFLDRRIEDVMRIETGKGKVREDPVLSRVLAGPMALMGRIRAPRPGAGDDRPGHWSGTNGGFD